MPNCPPFKQAYDRVPRAQLWQRLESMGYGGQWLRAVRALYADVPMSVTAAGLEGRVFSATQGLKQGCPLSPTLFSLYIADWEERVLSAAAAGMPLALPQLAGQPVPRCCTQMTWPSSPAQQMACSNSSGSWSSIASSAASRSTW